jgi:hypothetical protein
MMGRAGGPGGSGSEDLLVTYMKTRDTRAAKIDPVNIAIDAMIGYCVGYCQETAMMFAIEKLYVIRIGYI